MADPWLEQPAAMPDDPNDLAVALRRKYAQYTSLDPQKDESIGDTALQLGASLIPGVGQAMSLRDVERARRDNDPAGMAVGAAGLVPFGKVAGALRKPINELIGGIKGATRTGKEGALLAGDAALDAGHSADAVWQQHGMYRGPEAGMPPRYEIPDTNAQLGQRAIGEGKTRGKLGELLSHPEAYAAYPHLKDIDVNLSHGPGTDYSGQFVHRTGKYNGIPLNSSIDAAAEDPARLREVLLHEVNHAVQQYEGHDTGANSEAILAALRGKYAGRSDIKDSTLRSHAYDLYHHNMGEAESRMVERRSNMTADQLRRWRPGTGAGGMDVAQKTLIPEEKLPGFIPGQ